MGLDNGICVKRNNYSDFIKKMKRFEDKTCKKYQFDYDICYWRKCWNVRNDILDIIQTGENEEYHYELTVRDIQIIITILKSYNSKTWDYGSWSGSIWTWKEHRKINRRHIRNLKTLVKLMKKHPYLEVYFYDSY